jgi:hypothetical protein
MTRGSIVLLVSAPLTRYSSSKIQVASTAGTRTAPGMSLHQTD